MDFLTKLKATLNKVAQTLKENPPMGGYGLMAATLLSGAAAVRYFDISVAFAVLVAILLVLLWPAADDIDDLYVFNNPKPVIAAIIALLLLFCSYKAFSTEVEIGPTWTSGLNGGVGLTISERVLDDKFDVGITLVGEQRFEGETIGNNGNVWFSFVAERPQTWSPFLPRELHIGAAMWVNTDHRLIGSRQSWLLGLQYRFGDHWGLGVRHWSNAGIIRPNRGQDLLYISYEF